MGQKARVHKRSVSRQNKWYLVAVFVLLFGGVGTSVLLMSHAATPVNNAIEAESGAVTGNAAAVADTSGGISGTGYVRFDAPPATTGTGRCASTATRVCYNGNLVYINGINVPWRQWNTDFGGGAASGVIANKSEIATRLASIHATGSNVVRWWMFEGGAWQINRDSSGMPTSLNPAIYPDIDAALQLADQDNLYFDFCLFSGVGASDFPTTWRTNAAQRTALANVLGPLFARYKDNPRIMSWELFNEPEWQIWNSTDGANETDSVALAKALVSSIRTNAPKTMITIGEAQLTGIAMWKGVDLDFDSPHYYDNFTSNDVNPLVNTAAGLHTTYGTTRPIVIGEYPFVGTAAQNLARLNTWYSQGYGGAWDWSLFSEQTGDKIATDLPSITTFSSQHADLGPK